MFKILVSVRFFFFTFIQQERIQLIKSYSEDIYNNLTL